MRQTAIPDTEPTIILPDYLRVTVEGGNGRKTYKIAHADSAMCCVQHMAPSAWATLQVSRPLPRARSTVARKVGSVSEW